MKAYPQRKITRLKDYDYTQEGGYFVTICTQQQELMFGRIDNGEMRLNTLGEVAKNCWKELELHYNGIMLDEFCVMPNHIHGILILNPSSETDMASHVPTRGFGKPQAKSISSIIANFKSAVTRKIRLIDQGVEKVWQPRFYERIIRSESELKRIRNYIFSNPSQWQYDLENKNRL